MIPFGGVAIHSDPEALPEFYKISDFRNAEATATPVWLSMKFISGAWYGHPTLVEKLKRSDMEKNFKSQYEQTWIHKPCRRENHKYKELFGVCAICKGDRPYE